MEMRIPYYKKIEKMINAARKLVIIEVCVASMKEFSDVM